MCDSHTFGLLKSSFSAFQHHFCHKRKKQKKKAQKGGNKGKKGIYQHQVAVPNRQTPKSCLNTCFRKIFILDKPLLLPSPIEYLGTRHMTSLLWKTKTNIKSCKSYQQLCLKNQNVHSFKEKILISPGVDEFLGVCQGLGEAPTHGQTPFLCVFHTFLVFFLMSICEGKSC